MNPHFELLPQDLQKLTRILLLTSSVRADYRSYAPANIAVGVASRLLHVQTVAYGGQDVKLYTPGSRFNVFSGERRTPPVPQRALELALLLELAAVRTDGAEDALFSRQRHALVVRAGEHQGEVHMVRVEPPDVKSVRRALHDLLGGDHHDARLGPRNDYSGGVARHVVVHAPPNHVDKLRVGLAPLLERGGLSLAPVLLSEWPPQ
ncbi:hypothetical protein L1280_003098 [Deinococcus sp. HSC-46F16]|uniref:hypothetical protein n=1 Tax=Deinococcus sp. HSC-46F16 TaxID=2910968 RepID=UPI0020A0E100|nr:hypothetical protein [Deinococcus sp. HSC-46F16]MCP2015915.1 hypothetical protein [Deinococcus sp. HSC-46F16]